MHTKMNKCLSLFLVLAMVFSMMPTAAFAEVAADPAPAEAKIAITQNIPAAAKVGETVKVEFQLVNSGAGDFNGDVYLSFQSSHKEHPVTYTNVKANGVSVELKDNPANPVNYIVTVKVAAGETVKITADAVAKAAGEIKFKTLTDNANSTTDTMTVTVDPDRAAADSVQKLIDAIGEIDASDACYQRISAAKRAYNKLTPEQKALLPDAERTLQEADAKQHDMQMADQELSIEAAGFKALVEKIDTVTYTPECKAKIDAARESYNGLSAGAKKKAENLFGHNWVKILTDAEAKYAELEATAITVLFEDTTLQAAVAAFDTNKDGHLSTAEAEAVTELDVMDQPIASLKGIEIFKNLGYLEVSGTSITTLDVSMFPELWALYCTDAQIKKLDVSANSKLKYLELTDCGVTELNLGTVALWELEAGGNAITELDLSHFDYASMISEGDYLYVDIDNKDMTLILPAEGVDLTRISDSTTDAIELHTATGFTGGTVSEEKVFTFDAGKATATCTYNGHTITLVSADKALIEAANAVDAKIAEIGDVAYNAECKAKIDAAREAYDALSKEAQAYVTGLTTLTDAEAKYAELKAAADQAAADQAAAANVQKLIDAIGELDASDACAQRIEAARKAFNNLTPAQKKLLPDAEQTIQEAYAKQHDMQMADQELSIEAAGFKALVEKIGTVTYTPECKAKIDAARESYNGLSDGAKKKAENLFGHNWVKILTDAEAKYADLAPVAVRFYPFVPKGAGGGMFVGKSYIGSGSYMSWQTQAEGLVLKAQPAEGYRFVKWVAADEVGAEGVEISTSAELILNRVHQNKVLTPVFALCEHAALTEHEKKDATCTEAGYEAYWSCDVCGKLFSDAEGKTEIEAVVKIPAKGHALTEHAKQEATCTEAGHEAYWSCDVCGKLFSDAEGQTEIEAIVEIPAKGHTLTEHAKQEATCTEAGYEAYWSCDVCGKLFSDAEGKTEIEAVVEIPAKGHNFGEAWESDETGHWHVCDCGEKTEVAAHTYEWVIDKEATTTEAGSKHEHCSICGYNGPAVEIPVLANTDGWHSNESGWYYVENGLQVTDRWIEDTQGWCYLNADGYVAVNTWAEDSQGWCYLGEDGHVVVNAWAEDSQGWCYLGEDGHVVVNAWAEDSQGWRYLGEDGHVVVNAWAEDSQGWCYLNADGYIAVNTWAADSIGWCYLGEDGHQMKGVWIADSQGWCFLGDDGYIVTNAWKADSQGWCYLDGTGHALTDAWMADSIGWCYLDGSGRMAKSCWVMDSQGWCYLNDSGYMATDCWAQDSQGWCYLDDSGHMATNRWMQDSHGWCYLGDDGRMVKNQYVDDSTGPQWIGEDGYVA